MTTAPEQDGAHRGRAHAGVPVPPPLIYVAGLALGARLQRARPLPALPRRVAVPAGAVLAAAGAALDAASTERFRRARTSVLPMRPSSALVIEGPYRRTRNPMYVGMGLAHAGIAIGTRTTWALLLLPAVLATVDRVVIAREERYLAERFGDAYADYRARVPRWL